MPSWLSGRNLALAAGCAGAVAAVLFPGSLLTLGLGGVLGYKGHDWLAARLGIQAPARNHTSVPSYEEGGHALEDRGGEIP